MLNIIILLIGFVMLIKGADIFVDNSSLIARKFNVPSMIIGLTIVGMGTSAPELSVSITSALSGLNDMSIANVVGSNIFNLLLIIGITSFMKKLKITDYKNVFKLLIFAFIFLGLAIINMNLNRLDGIILLALFGYFLYGMFKQSREEKEENIEKPAKPFSIMLSMCILSLAMIVWGGNLVVDSASIIANQLGMSENLIGLTVVAVGTSLPELVTSFIATKKGEVDIAIGNVIGSNIFNILLILGAASVINPMVVSTVALIDIIFMITTVLIFIGLTFKSKSVNKYNGIILTVLYFVYMIYTIIR